MKVYKSNSVLTVLAFFVLLFAGCDKEEDLSLTDGADVYSVIELEILQLTNEYRVGLDKEPLVMDQTLWKYAHEHTDYMIAEGSISHDGFSERIDAIKAEIGGGSAAENVAMGYSTAKAVVDGWIDSDGHRENIEGDYNIIGIAAVKDANGRYYFTQIFLNN